MGMLIDYEEINYYVSNFNSKAIINLTYIDCTIRKRSLFKMYNFFFKQIQ